MADDISKVTPFWQWKEQQEARDTKENGGTPLLRSKDWYHREYGVFVQSSKRLGYATFENGKLRVDVGSFLKDNADRLESATTPAEVDGVQPVAWLVERDADPTFPRVYSVESDADEIVRYVNLPPRVRKSALYHADAVATLARQLAEAKAEAEKWRMAEGHAVSELQRELHESNLALREATRRLGEVEGLLRRYRNEVPLGHQPHMIAHLVDDLLTKEPTK